MLDDQNLADRHPFGVTPVCLRACDLTDAYRDCNHVPSLANFALHTRSDHITT